MSYALPSRYTEWSSELMIDDVPGTTVSCEVPETVCVLPSPSPSPSPRRAAPSRAALIRRRHAESRDMRDQMRSHRRHVPFSTTNSSSRKEETATDPLFEDVQNVEESLKAMQNVLMAYQTRNKRSSGISRSKSGESFGSSRSSSQSSLSDNSSRSLGSSAKSTLWS